MTEPLERFSELLAKGQELHGRKVAILTGQAEGPVTKVTRLAGGPGREHAIAVLDQQIDDVCVKLAELQAQHAECPRARDTMDLTALRHRLAETKTTHAKLLQTKARQTTLLLGQVIDFELAEHENAITSLIRTIREREAAYGLDDDEVEG